MRAFLRILFVIPAGLMAAIAASVAVYLAAFGFGEAELSGGPEGELPLVIAPVIVLLQLIAMGALLPFLIGVVASEIFSIRSAVAWTLFGGAIGLGMQLFGLPGSQDYLPPLASGFAAGFAYWLVAGHGAGRTRPPTADAERSPLP